MSEIELKFVTRQSALTAFIEKVLPALDKKGVDVSKAQERRLENDYYDTSKHDFQRHKMGFRVRGNNGEYEQTLKTHGKVSGGLHERAEYNVSLKSAQPDLKLLPSQAWPENWRVDQLNDKLERQFSTHFVRTAFDIKLDGSHVELVIDEGEAKTGKASSPICEIELELIDGEVSALFRLAEIVNEHMAVRLSDVSKAAQGYQLLHGISATVEPMKLHLPLTASMTTEEAFCAAAQYALAHWQRHEHLFFETGAVKLLDEVVKSQRLLLQTVSLYLPVLQCPELLKLHQSLLKYAQLWLWQDDLQSLRYLLSKKSLFHKCLNRFPSLISYLQGRKAGLIHAHAPEALFYDSQTAGIKLQLSELLHSRPWRAQASTGNVAVMEHAKGWLSQGWQTVLQTLPDGKEMTPENYLAVEVMLRQTLWNGFLLADLFDEAQQEFRAPWLDIMTGIDELKALMMLRSMVDESELDELDEVYNWLNEKTASLMQVMERTRIAGMQGDVYW